MKSVVLSALLAIAGPSILAQPAQAAEGGPVKEHGTPRSASRSSRRSTPGAPPWWPRIAPASNAPIMTT
ncbi:hypothetical protein ACFSTI_05065 [Rhizorhabdus histidinilytica]